MKIKNAYLHIKKICIHKLWVGKYCFMAGIPLQGITHDLSKFHPIELFESIKYYQGTSSPINACKKDKGWSQAWMHHKGMNPHHYEYWEDEFDHGGKPLIMPYKYAVEMLCDFLGAGRAYQGENFSYRSEYKWWLAKRDGCAMHPAIKDFISAILIDLMIFSASERDILKPKNLKRVYKRAIQKNS